MLVTRVTIFLGNLAFGIPPRFVRIAGIVGQKCGGVVVGMWHIRNVDHRPLDDYRGNRDDGPMKKYLTVDWTLNMNRP